MAEFTVDTTHVDTDQTVKIPEVDETGTVVDHRFAVRGLTREVARSYNRLLRDVKDRQTVAEHATNGAATDDEVDELAALYFTGIAIRLDPINGAPQADTLLERLWQGGRLTIDKHLGPLMSHLYSGVTEPDPPA